MAKQPESTTKPQPGRVMDLKPGTYCGHEGQRRGDVTALLPSHPCLNFAF